MASIAFRCATSRRTNLYVSPWFFSRSSRYSCAAARSRSAQNPVKVSEVPNTMTIRMGTTEVLVSFRKEKVCTTATNAPTSSTSTTAICTTTRLRTPRITSSTVSSCSSEYRRERSAGRDGASVSSSPPAAAAPGPSPPAPSGSAAVASAASAGPSLPETSPAFSGREPALPPTGRPRLVSPVCRMLRRADPCVSSNPSSHVVPGK
mmetsp:Transcript_30908/g.53530  ORF Transcript_30908/g.53530 Transcript_30908/m.53530 type:complete len:206 (-) Transcript_30908:618-1235(-)